MAEKSSPQPQSGDNDSKKEFTSLPAGDDKKEVGQDTKSLAPLLHWDVPEDEE